VKWVLYGLLAGAAFVLLVGYAVAAPPFPITITTCEGYVVSKRGDGTIFVRCPNAPRERPLFTIAPGCCMNPVVTKRVLSVTIDCR
jgi:hypothetical protein